MNPAEEGGTNKFLDHELLYIYFNKESGRIKELMDKSAYYIPKNEAIGRADEHGYIFNFIKDKLHMRFTMRTKNITTQPPPPLSTSMCSSSGVVFHVAILANLLWAGR